MPHNVMPCNFFLKFQGQAANQMEGMRRSEWSTSHEAQPGKLMKNFCAKFYGCIQEYLLITNVWFSPPDDPPGHLKWVKTFFLELWRTKFQNDHDLPKSAQIVVKTLGKHIIDHANEKSKIKPT